MKRASLFTLIALTAAMVSPEDTATIEIRATPYAPNVDAFIPPDNALKTGSYFDPRADRRRFKKGGKR